MEAIFRPLMAGVLQEGLMGAMSQSLHHDLSGLLLRGASGAVPPLRTASAAPLRGEVGQQLLGATIELLAQVRSDNPCLVAVFWLPVLLCFLLLSDLCGREEPNRALVSPHVYVG
jgi:hypothetical protein